ncbi:MULTISPECIES: helicase-related protein [Streptomyces]|uniref:Helicase-related protein n=1 Tax=Streptomyces caniscabiei TaxID=2746961 RepID=A0ABU4MTI7_9ACTN|nr:MULTISPECIES: helicase-related protein [Streptomyces]MBE4740108.1 DEAD/DEAH box helicase [Streptomyces caniscabiei]MBE4758998.1 DEAD/DEAH box helicase [Streptomyces caniscabiei]MBE4772867.1 DEAD/DEAH box helicase [Streptomyces caniscabiei]MBE4788244.1 DEAD/DEAH box helicase [Streptomyces caniscabiei]MBE4797483.1 DEAD/DEAH box helicase [Streptomyces caniscabiei]
MTQVAGRHSEHYRVRDEELVRGLRRELLGPDTDAAPEDRDEVLAEDAPIDRYLTGVLYPRSADATAEQRIREDEAEHDGLDIAPLRTRDDIEESGTAQEVGAASSRRPSSMGLTFAIDPAISDSIVVSARAAVYEPTDPQGNRIAARRAEARTTSDQRERWRRRPLALPDTQIDVTTPAPDKTFELGEGARLRVNVRRPHPTTGTVTITVTLVNTHQVGERELQDAFSLFQCGLTVRSVDGSTAFVERPAPTFAHDAEVATSRLLHRHAPTFAVGHGCAAEWDWTPPPIGMTDTRRAAVAEVRSEFVPAVEVLLTDSNPEIDSSALSMLGLAEKSDSEVLTALDDLAAGYRQWIDRKAAEAEALAGEPHEQPALDQVEACREALDRIREGIELLRTEPDLMRAFRLANHAMADQRARSAWVKSGRAGTLDPAAGRWRPFQIAFVLLCLAGIDDPDHRDREVSDLLWFPTGGGKTEAYLGLIAVTSFLRRIRKGTDGGGVTVLMRYTLRLLTLQQFERASILLCAMENIRRRTPELGHEEFSIGMWVGRSATPNTLSVAGQKLDELRRSLDKRLATENPVQLHACPWCGTRLDARNYEVDEDAQRMHVRCPGRDCEFADGLPVHLIDEAVYDARPTLVIATVDKFASMPWRPATSALFNLDDPDDGTPPPELIIQDELHLISGPLGTLTGLYETAVDALAKRPKVIASTATIRRAAEQSRHLFARGVRQFPPAGLDARDSWFAVETPREEKASRRYVGLLAPGTSQSTLLIRTYATLLHRANQAKTEDEVRDAYWSLVGYFNSLRLLSAAELQVHDDVVAYLELLAGREGVAIRSIANYSELTSRVDASEIPTRLKGIEKRFPDDDAVDVLLATNMIAVGVDVDRLGLMAVMGQPQTTAEYIQATSRVGRAHPGLVAVMLNSTRSRDRSHYESFQYFHSALYREVESTSVTPFSARARDRGLHAVIVALARILIPAARPNEGAGKVEAYEDVLRGRIRTVLLERVQAVSPEEVEVTAHAFDEFVDWWCEEADIDGGLLFEPRRGSRAPSLLKAYDDESENAEAWATLWSLRDVDAESALFMEGSR